MSVWTVSTAEQSLLESRKSCYSLVELLRNMLHFLFIFIELKYEVILFNLQVHLIFTECEKDYWLIEQIKNN